MDRKTFFNLVRASVFGGKLTQVQVDALGVILDEAARRALPLPYIAYIMATVKWETAHTMRWDIREFGQGKGRKYGRAVTVAPGLSVVFYGRGWPQLTWDFNYQAMGKLLGINLYTNPDLALTLANTSKITFEGMLRGTFTGKALKDYLDGDRPSFVEARRVVNGTDRASTIAAIADKFLAALLAASDLSAIPSAPKPQPKAHADALKDGAGATGVTGGTGTSVSPAGADAWVMWGGVLIAVVSLAWLGWRFRHPISIHLSLLAARLRDLGDRL